VPPAPPTTPAETSIPAVTPTGEPGGEVRPAAFCDSFAVIAGLEAGGEVQESVAVQQQVAAALQTAAADVPADLATDLATALEFQTALLTAQNNPADVDALDASGYSEAMARLNAGVGEHCG
jgi:hypothetical protein